MKLFKNLSLGFLIVRVITSIMLFWALLANPYSYYNILRIVVCAVCVYAVVKSISVEKNKWAWVFGVLAFVFNPIIPVHLDREAWAIIDVISGIVILISIFFIRSDENAEQNKE